MKKYIAFVIVLLFVNQLIMSQTDGGRASDSKITEVSKGIYMYQNRGGNIGLSIGNDGVFMIDDQFEELSEDILKDISRFSNKPVKFVLNTHHHGDHTGGNANMVKQGATIIAHDNVRKRLKDYIDNSDKKVDEKILPDVTFNEGINFYFNGERIAVYYLSNAHTDGDAVVHFTESNILHTGDAFVKGQYPFIDSRNGGTVEGYRNGLEQILSYCDKNTKIIPGHGNIANMNDVRDFMRMMSIAWQNVVKHFLDGKSEAEIVSMRSFMKEFDDKGYGEQFITREQFLRSIYKEVAVKNDTGEYIRKQELILRLKKEQGGGE